LILLKQNQLKLLVIAVIWSANCSDFTKFSLHLAISKGALCQVIYFDQQAKIYCKYPKGMR